MGLEMLLEGVQRSRRADSRWWQIVYKYTHEDVMIDL